MNKKIHWAVQNFACYDSLAIPNDGPSRKERRLAPNFSHSLQEKSRSPRFLLALTFTSGYN